jgi:hypothetical protein
MPATAESWRNRRPFTAGEPLPYNRVFTPEQFARLHEGKIPRVMEDKWFIYYDHDEEYLFLHRSWTGKPMYRVAFIHREDGVHVSEALLPSEPGYALTSERLEYEALLLDFLISNLLLGDRKPFPLLPGVSSDPKGLMQHQISGTGYPTEVTKPKPNEDN